MKAHPGLSRAEVTRYPAEKITLMVASEFLRAADRVKYPDFVKNCFRRARELMGILETVPLRDDVALTLKDIYAQCGGGNLFQLLVRTPEDIRRKSLELAGSFEAASRHLKGNGHA